MKVRSLGKLMLCLCASLFTSLSDTLAQTTAAPEAGDVFAYFKYYKRGIELYDLGRYEEAAEEFGRAIILNPRDASSHYNLGMALGSLDQRQKAVVAYRRAIRLAPDHSKSHFQLCATLAAVGRNWEAVDACREAVKFNRGNAAPYFHLGRAHSCLGLHEQAALAFELAIKHKPDLAEAHLRLGQTLYKIGRYEESLDSVERAIRLGPDLREAKLELAKMLKNLERLDTQAGTVDDPTSYELMGDVMRRLGQFPKAIKAYRKALEKRPTDGEMFFKLGLTYYNSARYGEAIWAYKQAIRFLPDPTKAKNNLSWVSQLRKGKSISAWKQNYAPTR